MVTWFLPVFPSLFPAFFPALTLQQINDAVVQSSKLFIQVMDVVEAIAQDPASIPPLIEGVHIDVHDAQELASSYRTGLF